MLDVIEVPAATQPLVAQPLVAQPLVAQPLAVRVRAARPVAVAPFALVRVAMLPYDALIDLVPATFRALLDRAAEAQLQTAERAQVLAAALHGVVPLCGDVESRRATLNSKRALYTGAVRDIDATIAVLRTLPAPPRVAALSEVWYAGAALARTLEAELSAAWPGTQAAGRVALRALLARDEIGAAVSVASPELIAMLGRSDRSKRLKAELSLTRYVTRAATKTSPFSSLTGVLPSAFDDRSDAGIDLGAVAWTRSARVNRALCAAVDYAASGKLAAAPAARVVRCASFRAAGDGRAQWLAPDYFAVLGRPWRAARPVSVRIHPAVIELLLALDEPSTIAELQTALGRLGLEPAKATALLTMLLERGALRDAGAPDAYSDAVDGASRFARLRACVAGVAGSDPASREGALAAARREADTLTAAAGLSERLALKNVVLETCTGAAPDPVLGAAIRRICADAGAAIGRRIGVNPVYGVLRELFLQTYGPQGRANLVEFIERGARLWGDTHGYNQLKAGVGRVPAPDVPAPFTVFGQLGVPGDPVRFVINSVVAGTGQLSARYAASDNDRSGFLREALAGWLARCAGDAVATDVTLAGDCNDLQSHPQITERILPWAADFVQPGRPGVDRAADLWVEYDTLRHALRVRDSDGRLRALSYLGAVYLNAAYGAEFLLQALGQPYIAALPEYPDIADSDRPVRVQPRIVEDGIVLRRARWLVSSAYLRGWFARGDVRDMVDVRLQCRRDGLPLQFFVRAMLPDARYRLDAPLDARKPQWIDTENPLCLALLRRLFDVSPWLEIVEMLPDRRGMPSDAAGEPHATELQFEITV